MRSRWTTMTLSAAALALALGAAGGASAQSSAASYSYGTYNPVQAAINRNSMNAAIIRQATGKGPHAATRKSAKAHAKTHKRAG